MKYCAIKNIRGKESHIEQNNHKIINNHRLELLLFESRERNTTKSENVELLRVRHLKL